MTSRANGKISRTTQAWLRNRFLANDLERAALNGPRWRQYIAVLDHIRAARGEWLSISQDVAPIIEKTYLDRGTEFAERTGRARQARRIVYTLEAAGVVEIGESDTGNGGRPSLFVRSKR